MTKFLEEDNLYHVAYLSYFYVFFVICWQIYDLKFSEITIIVPDLTASVAQW